MKKLILALLAVSLLLSSLAFAEGQFRVGMECDYPPFNWTQVEPDENSVPIEGGMGYAGGYDVEIAKRIAASLDMELVVVKIEWDGLIPALNSGMIDAVIAGMSPTAEWWSCGPTVPTRVRQRWPTSRARGSRPS